MRLEVLHRYTARDPDEMDLQESDIVEVYRKMDDGGSTPFEDENEIESESETKTDREWHCENAIIDTHIYFNVGRDIGSVPTSMWLNNFELNSFVSISYQFGNSNRNE